LNNRILLIINIDQEIAIKASQLRAKYSFLKGLDALQIATALVSDCDLFITNDVKLSKINDIHITLISRTDIL